MTRYDKRFCLPAAGVSAVAIYVDAIGSLKLGDLFVFFMSGTSAHLAIGAIVDSQIALIAVRLLAGLVVAVVAGTALGRVAGTRRKPAVLGVRLPFPYGCGVRECQPSGSGTALTITVVMGAANTVCQRAGEVRIGVTYMTGALVKRGHRLAGTLRQFVLGLVVVPDAVARVDRRRDRRCPRLSPRSTSRRLVSGRGNHGAGDLCYSPGPLSNLRKDPINHELNTSHCDRKKRKTRAR